MKKYNVAIVGATGLVGETMIRVLEERKFPVQGLYPLASEDSRGKKAKFGGKDWQVEALSKNSFSGIDFALFSAGADVSLEYAPIAAAAGAIVIDNTSAFRMKPDVPLVVPEVNGDVIASVSEAISCKQFNVGDCRVALRAPPAKRPAGRRNDNKGCIIANPNCSTIQLVCVLKPIHDAARIKRVVVSTYQSVSGAGREAIDELHEQTTALLNHRTIAPSHHRTIFPHPIAFNCIPHIDKFEPNGYTKEEMKVVRETKKIMGDDSIAVTCTAVRVPVRVGHSEAVNIETEKKLSSFDVQRILNSAPSVVVVDDLKNAKYPLAIDAAGRDEVFVGRIREDVSCERGISLWIVSDNLRKGAATNAVQIAELMIK